MLRLTSAACPRPSASRASAHVAPGPGRVRVRPRLALPHTWPGHVKTLTPPPRPAEVSLTLSVDHVQWKCSEEVLSFFLKKRFNHVSLALGALNTDTDTYAA